MIPIVQITMKIPSSFGFTAFRSMIMEGSESVVIAIIKDSTTPRGRPALVKPINSGMDEQEQKGRHRAEQRCNQIGPDSPEPAQDPSASFRREKALNVGDHKNQNA